MNSLQAPEIQARLRRVKLLVLDVDGIMTDGRLFWMPGPSGTGADAPADAAASSPPAGAAVLAGHWLRTFHIHDGYGIRTLMKHGIDVAVISGGDSADVRTRIKFLGIRHAFLGNEDKLTALNELVQRTGIEPAEMAYMGDDLFDIPVLERVGFAATVPQAVPAVRKRVHYITEVAAGSGAVREIADAIRQAQELGPYRE